MCGSCGGGKTAACCERRPRRARGRLLAAVLAAAVAAAPGAAPAEWTWDRTREGWFWYEDPPAPAAREAPPSEAPRDEPEPADPRDPAVREGLKRWPVDEARLARLPVAWLRALQDAKLERALEEPTPEVVREYLLVHREHFRRAQGFSDLWRLVLYTHPELDPAAAHPVSTAGLKVADALEREARAARLAAWSERAGLYFFFRSACPYCRAFAPVLRLFASTHGWRVVAVTQDGQGLPEFPDARPDEGVGEAIGVRSVPAVYLAVPEDRFLAPVGQGFLTLSELEERVLAVLDNRERLARKEGRR